MEVDSKKGVPLVIINLDIKVKVSLSVAWIGGILTAEHFVVKHIIEFVVLIQKRCEG